MRICLFMLLLVSVITTASAVNFADPRSVIQAVYARYYVEENPPADGDIPMEDLQTAELNELFRKDSEEAGEDMGRLDFDPYVFGQDYEVTDLTVGEPSYEDDKATIVVEFKNYGEKRKIHYRLLKVGDSWKIDDLWQSEGESPYRLREILEAPLGVESGSSQ